MNQEQVKAAQNRPEKTEWRFPNEKGEDSRRTLFIMLLAMCVGVAAGFVAQIVVALIGFVTNLSFFGRISTAFSSPSQNHLGAWVIVIPVIGGIIVGFIARYGSAAIRGHGIPETMEQVLVNQSRVPPRITILKPLSAAIAIGTGGPFGAEGPIIATGGALGSLLGQLLNTTADERKTLLAAGAGAGMAAIFGSPVSAVLIAIELLLFEYRSRSFIPVALASVSAMAVRIAFVGMTPVFGMPTIGMPSERALILYVVIGAIAGFASVLITKAAYWIEDAFDHLPIHWMWWPAIGGVAVGVIGYFFPLTLGVGYDNIVHTLGGDFTMRALILLAIFKFLSWAISLGSGTSGGTLAPLFTIGGALGAVVGIAFAALFPSAGIDIRVAALVGMAALFAGASRALLASVIFAFETTLQSSGLLPLLGGCAVAYLISKMMMDTTIMTEKITRRGLRVPSDYAADHLDRHIVSEFASKTLITLQATTPVSAVREWIQSRQTGSTHQGFPVLDSDGYLLGIVTRRSIFDRSKPDDMNIADLITRAPVVVYGDTSLRDAADLMVRESVGRLPVVMRENPLKATGIITRSDLLRAHDSRLEEALEPSREIQFLNSEWFGSIFPKNK